MLLDVFKVNNESSDQSMIGLTSWKTKKKPIHENEQVITSLAGRVRKLTVVAEVISFLEVWLNSSHPV